MKNFFEFEWMLQQSLMNFAKKYGKKMDILINIIFVTIVVFLLLLFLNINVHYIILLTLLILYILFNCISKSLNFFTSLTCFFENSLLVVFIISTIILYLVIGKSGWLININIDSLIKIYITIIVVLSVLWFCFSTFCDAKIATISNAIFSAIITLLLQLNTFIWDIYYIDNNTIFPDEIVILYNKLGYNDIQFSILLVNIVFWPLYIMFVVGTIGSIIKEHWINKFNDKHDITKAI